MVAVRALLSTLNGIAQVGPARRQPRVASRNAGRGRNSSGRGPEERWDEGAYAHAGDEPLLEDLLQ